MADPLARGRSSFAGVAASKAPDAGPASAIPLETDGEHGPEPLVQLVPPLARLCGVSKPDRTSPSRVRRAGATHAHAHRARHASATWAIENQAREIDVQYLLGHSTSAMVRRYAASYGSAKAVEAHRAFSPVERLPNA